MKYLVKPGEYANHRELAGKIGVFVIRSNNLPQHSLYLRFGNEYDYFDDDEVIAIPEEIENWPVEEIKLYLAL